MFKTFYNAITCSQRFNLTSNLVKFKFSIPIDHTNGFHSPHILRAYVEDGDIVVEGTLSNKCQQPQIRQLLRQHSLRSSSDHAVTLALPQTSHR